MRPLIALCCCHQACCLLYYLGEINSGIHMCQFTFELLHFCFRMWLRFRFRANILVDRRISREKGRDRWICIPLEIQPPLKYDLPYPISMNPPNAFHGFSPTPLSPKKHFFFPLDFKTTLTKHLLTQFILTGILLLIGPPLLTLKSWESWVEEIMTSKTH